jgi:hypothetical protein
MRRALGAAGALALLVATTSGAGSAGRAGERRVGFTVLAVEETGSERTVLGETVIEGPPGTDFDLDVRARHFSLHGRFITDVAGDEIEVSADIEARRSYGLSPRGLPLYEIDRQDHSLRVGFDRAIAIYPWGSGRAGSAFKIEIAPVWVEAGSDGIDVRIERPAPGGMIAVRAHRIPHRFLCQARLIERGRELARQAAPCRYGRPSEIELADLVVAVTVDGYTPARPIDLVSLRFDVDRALERGRTRQAIARGWAGRRELGGELAYDVDGGRQLVLSVAAP